MTSEALEVASNFTTSFKSGDMDAILDLLDDRVVFHEPEDLPYGRDFHGKEGFAELARTVARDYELLVHSEEYFDLGHGRVLSELVVDIKAHRTGKKFRMPVMELYTIADGRILDADIFFKSPSAMYRLLEP